MVICSAYRCANNQRTTNGNVCFHRFPKNPEMRTAWIKALRRKNFEPTNSSRLCSQHFTEEMYDRSSKIKIQLRKDAIPTIFKKFPIYHQKRSEEMVIACVLCRRTSRADETLSFHGFPFKQPEVLQKWVEVVDVEDFQLRKTHRICSAHFKEEDFQFGHEGGRKFLKEDAFPTLFLHYEDRVLLKTQTKSDLNPEIPHESAEKPNVKPTKETTGWSAEEITDSSAEETTDSPGDSDISDNSQKIKVLHQVSQENIIQQVNIETTSCSENIKITANSSKKHLRKKIRMLQQTLRRRDKKIADLKRRNRMLLKGYGESLQCIF